MPPAERTHVGRPLIEVAGPGDYQAIAEFLASFPEWASSADAWLERMNAWWDQNPAFRDGEIRGWVIRDGSVRSPSVVGFLGRIPSLFKLDDQTIVVYNSSTWAVAPAYRGMSLPLLLNQTRAAKDTLLFVGTPAPEVVMILKKMGFALLPRGPDAGGFRRFGVFVTDPTPLLARTLPLWAAKLAGYCGRALLTIPTLWLRPARDLHVRVLDRADHSFDALWDRTKDSIANTNVRTRDIVDWYCFGSGSTGKHLIACFSGVENFGYAVGYPTEHEGIRRLHCVDLWYRTDRPGVLGALLHGLVTVARREGIPLVLVPHFTARLGQRLTRHGFVSVPYRERTDYFRVGTKLAGLIGHDNSYFVANQGDFGI